MMLRLKFRALTAVLALAVLSSPAAALVIRGDYLWVQGPKCVEGWHEPGFDDSQWTPAVYPNILMWHRDWERDAEARPMWGDDYTSCVRRHFHLDEAPRVANVKVWVDDDYELYINGTFIGRSNDGWAEMPGEAYDVASALHAGDNVIAMQLIDRVGEHHGALFVLTVPGARDEPPSWKATIGAVRHGTSAVVLVLVAVALVLVARALGNRLAPALGKLPTIVLAAIALALVAAAQWCLQTLPMYDYIIGQPITTWSIPSIGAVVLLLMLLHVTMRAQPISTRVEQPPKGELWLVLAILALAAYLRAVEVDTIPPGFFQDEAINGIDSIRLFQIPNYEMWSDSIGGRPTLFLYAVGATLQVFGISYAALKIVPVAVGIASVLALYLVGRQALGPRAALWAMFLFAVSRWHIHFSRMAWEVNCVPLFSALGLALLLYGLQRRGRAILTLTAAALVLAAGLYTYAAYRAVGGVVAVFLVATLFSSQRRLLLDKFWGLAIAGIAAVALLAPLMRFAMNNPALYWARYTDVSLTTYMSYHSTPLPWLHQIGKAVLSLNHRGDLDTLPFLEPLSGMLLLLGAVSVAPSRYRLGLRLVWCWFLTFAALSSLTKDSPHATRMLGMLPPAMLLAGYGAFRLFDLLRAIALPRGLRAVVAAAVVFVATGLNVYWYFGGQQQLPEIDLTMNEGARVLCTDLAERGGTMFWTDDVAYNCKPQCTFLFAARRLPLPEIITVDDLIQPQRMRAAKPPVTVMINVTTLERAGDRIRRDVNGDPILDLPGRPTVMQTREGKPSYFVYRF